MKKKLLLTMKLALIFVFLSVLQVSANVYSQITVNLDVQDKSIREVLKTIEQQSQVRFFYSDDLLVMNEKIGVKADNKNIINVLDDIFSKSPLTYKTYDNNLIVIVPRELLQQQKVSGTVYDANTGEPLPGVYVTVQGTLTGTVTDVNGKYSLNLDDRNAVLAFSFIGYITANVAAEGRSTVDIRLVPQINPLDEVVVVGYGTSKRRDVTGSVASIDEADFKNLTITNTSEILKGRAAGVSITETSGKPGGDYKIRIRGANSILGDNSPLLVVDGIQTDISLEQINPSDIASIDILKDASSTAIYGSRGANGVIIVTTKNGVEGPPVLEISSYVSFKYPHNPYELMETSLYAKTVNEIVGSEVYTQSEINNFKTSGGYNMYNALIQNGLLQSHKVTLRGGTKAIQYFISGGMNHEDGVLIETSFDKYMIRSNFSSQVSKKLSLELSLNATKTTGHNISSNYNQLMCANLWGPTVKILNDDGTYNMFDAYGFEWPSPYMLMKEANHDNDETVGIIGATIKYDILPGLTFNSNIGYNLGISNNAYLNNEFMAIDMGVTGSGQSSIQNNYWQFSNTLTYLKTFRKIHSLTLMAGFEESKNTNTGFSAEGSDMATTSVGYDNLSLNKMQVINSSYSSSSMRSYFTRVNYSLKDRYLLTLTYRADGSSKFRESNRFSYFPSVGLAWRISEENFIKDLNFFNNLKLRASWGKTGSQAIGSYGTMSLLTQQNYSFGSSNIYPGYKPYGAANPDLRWETTTQSDLGLDVAFLKDKVSISMDVFQKTTTDLLQAVEVPDYNGGGEVIKNIGEIENKGFEFSLNVVPVNKGNWRWDVGYNLSYIKNEVKSLGDVDIIFPGESNLYLQENQVFAVMKGQPLGTFYGLKWQGIWRTSEASEAAKYGLVPGDNKFEDVNKDNSIGGSDYQPIGHAVPTLRMGLNTSVSFKKFTLDAAFESAFGGVVYNVTYGCGAITTTKGRTITIADGADYWTPTNDDARYASLTSSNNSFENTSQWLQNGNYVKLKNIRLTYDLSKQKTRFADLKLFVSAQNLFTVTKYKGSDPESSNSGGSDVDSAIDLGVYPTVKTLTTGLTLTF